MDSLEYDILLLQGYNPENTQACRDFKAGKMDIDTLWHLLCRNVNIIEGPSQKLEKPRKKDRVKQGERWGHILWINYDEQEVYVFFYDKKRWENIPLDNFDGNYDSRGGRTTWLLD